jgi:hypothetical protein
MIGRASVSASGRVSRRKRQRTSFCQSRTGGRSDSFWITWSGVLPRDWTVSQVLLLSPSLAHRIFRQVKLGNYLTRDMSTIIQPLQERADQVELAEVLLATKLLHVDLLRQVRGRLDSAQVA